MQAVFCLKTKKDACRRAVSMIEYSLVASLIAALVIGAVSVLGRSVSDPYCTLVRGIEQRIIQGPGEYYNDDTCQNM